MHRISLSALSDAVLDEARLKVRYINNVITPAGPKHGHMTHEETRLLTFQDWPQAMPQKPQDLAEAGFFYLGLFLQIDLRQ